MCSILFEWFLLTQCLQFSILEIVFCGKIIYTYLAVWGQATNSTNREITIEIKQDRRIITYPQEVEVYNLAPVQVDWSERPQSYLST